MPGPNRKFIYTFTSPEGREIIQGCYASDRQALSYFIRMYPDAWRARCHGPHRRRERLPGELVVSGGDWRMHEPPAYALEPVPDWFVDAVGAIPRGAAETMAVVGRRARHYAVQYERMLAERARAPHGDSAMALHLDVGRSMADLLWAALGAMQASGIVLTVPPAAQA